MSNVRTRKRGKYWEYEFDAAKVAGKRNRISKSGYKTKAEAVAAGAAAMAEYNSSGIKFIPSEMSYADFLDYWIESYCLITLKKTTLDNYKKRIKSHIKPSLGAYKLTSLTTAGLQKFINSKIDAQYSLNTLSVLRGILTGSLQYAVRQNMLKSNPAREIRIPTERSTESLQLRSAPHRYLPPDVIEKIFERFPEKHPSHIPLMLGYRCGLRLGEAFAITWDCVDLEKGQIYINKQVQWNPAEQWWFFTNPKFNSFRTIDLDNSLLELLRRERKRQDKDRAYYEDMYTVYYENDVRGLVTSPDQASSATPIELMLVRQDGSYIQARTMQHASSVIHYELGVKDFTFHSLRHTHATMLAEAGMPQKYTQQRLGHKDISVTLKYYTHLTDKMSEIGGKILESMFADNDDD
ncbi:MAG: site-specific integrase [Alistipes sp.]|nr:site-specific integrase [Clostridia bacterium]MBR2398717.1 site-specific integrase [Alistipes sp.]